MNARALLGLMFFFALMPEAGAADASNRLGDPQAGYVLDLADSEAWVSEISYSPGITSKLCIERADPSMILCVQSLQRPIAVEDRVALAEGYFAAIEGRFPSNDTAAPLAVELGLLVGSQRSFVTSAAELPQTRRWVVAFAGTNTLGQPQMAVAFADPGDAARAGSLFSDVLASIVYQNGT